MSKRSKYEDELVEFTPRHKGTIYGVRNGSYRAYVWDLGRPPESWERYRYTVELTWGTEGSAYKGGSNKLSEAVEIARSAVSGREFRAFLRRVRG